MGSQGSDPMFDFHGNPFFCGMAFLCIGDLSPSLYKKTLPDDKKFRGGNTSPGKWRGWKSTVELPNSIQEDGRTARLFYLDLKVFM
jgi:hypothetical protein